MPDPVQTALMIPAQEPLVDDFVATLNSIREQSHVPWVIHIMDFGDWTIYNARAAEAIDNLRFFCPRVHTVRYPVDYDMGDAYIENKNHLDDYAIPVVVLVANTPLAREAMWEISYPFLNPDVKQVTGRYEDMRPNKGWFGRLWYRMTRRARTDLVAYRNWKFKGER